MAETKISVKALFCKGLRDSSFYFISDFLSKVISIFIIPVIARMVSVKEFGIYDMFILVANIVVMISTLGMDSGGAILIAENIHDRKVLSLIIGFQIILNIIVLIILWMLSCLFFALGINKFFSLFEINWLFIYSLFYLLIYDTSSFLRWTGKAKQASIVNFLSIAGSIITGFIIFYFAPVKKIDVFLSGLALGLLGGVVFSIYLLKNHLINFKLSKINLIKKDLLKLSIPYIPAYMANYVMRITDRLIVISFLDPTALGYYALASRISAIPQQVLFSFSKGLRPIMFQNYKNESGKKMIKKVYEWYISLIPFALILAIFFAKPLTLLFGGTKYYNAIPLVPILLASTLYFSSIYFDGFGYSIKRKTYAIPIITGIAILVNIVISILLLKKFNIVGVALGTFFSSIFVSFVYAFFAEKLYPFQYNFRKIFFFILLSIIIITIKKLEVG